MPMFPKLEVEITLLAEKMVSGFTKEPGYFMHADVAALQTALAAYMAALNTQTQLAGELKRAVEIKQAALRALKACMQAQLRQAEADTAYYPERLFFIGWAMRAVNMRAVPGQPRVLSAERLERNVVRLHWRAPRWGDGGRIRTYSIERRGQQADGSLCEWAHVAVALTPELLLPNEPRGGLLEYRIVALNNAGYSQPSNVVSVIL